VRQPSPTSKRAQPAAEILTFLIADVRGYTAFTQAHGDEAAGHLAAAFAEIAREGVEARGGSVIELRGDEALAVFASARQALRAAVDLQLTFVDEVQRDPTLPLRVGIGLDAGEAVPVEDGYRGGALNLAARLCGRAGPGEVLVSQGVLLLARAVEGLAFHDTGTHALKGLEEPVQIFQATIAGQEPGEILRRLDDAAGSDRRRRPAQLPAELDRVTPLVGRDTEARRLRWAWRQARRGPARVVAVEGPPGSGRTRFAAEVAQLAAADGARIAYGTGDDGDLLDRPAPSTDQPELTIVEIADRVDDRALDAVRSWSSRPTGMTVLLVAPGDDGGRRIRQVVDDGNVVRLGPLDLHAVEAIASLYLPGGAEGAPTQAILEASDGLPARIHALASDWAKTETSRRLGSAAALAAERRDELRSIETTLADNVIDLQLVRERAELFVEGLAQETIDGTRTPPYRALATFDVVDAPLFFGRERLVADMVGRLAGSALLGVVGPSGSGKSSAVRAGLLAALASDAMPGGASWAQARTPSAPSTAPSGRRSPTTSAARSRARSCRSGWHATRWGRPTSSCCSWTSSKSCSRCAATRPSGRRS
jgi:class 3 adenylate cyclase